MYGRKWMTRMIISLVSTDSIAMTSEAAAKGSVAEGQKVIKDQIKRFLDGFLAKEKAATQKGHRPDDVTVYEAYRQLVLDLLAGFEKLDPRQLHRLEWVNKPLLSGCTQSKYDPIVKAVNALLNNTSPASPLTKAKDLVSVDGVQNGALPEV